MNADRAIPDPLSVDARIAASISIVLTFALRVLAIRLNWRTRPLGPRVDTQA